MKAYCYSHWLQDLIHVRSDINCKYPQIVCER